MCEDVAGLLHHNTSGSRSKRIPAAERVNSAVGGKWCRPFLVNKRLFAINLP